MIWRWRSAVLPVCGGLIGAVFNLIIGGPRLIDPREFGWLMKFDWRIHFLGWHLFRNEPWHWPPGRMDAYYHAPDGTALAFTDSIPLVALMLKPFSAMLPMPFQYIGLWLLLCFALQGVFGVLLTRIWTPNPLHQLLGAALFVTIPGLLNRVGHPSLCAHFIVLWALWLYLRGKQEDHPSSAQHAALGLCAGLVHPYLAVMALALVAARVLRDRDRRALAAFATVVVACVAGWWAAGLFTVSGAENFASEGLGFYSMNLLSPFTPSGWSAFLPPLPVATEGQVYEGFQYLGLGLLLLVALAVVVAMINARALAWVSILPIVLVCVLFAIYALSPRVTLADRVVLDWSSPQLERWALFRATGRFFWPMAYLIVAVSIGMIAARLRSGLGAAVLGAALLIQLADLRVAHAERRITSRSEGFYAWENMMPSPVWHDLLTFYKHIVIAPPRQCASAPIGFESPAYLAGLHGLTINSAAVARFDEVKQRRYCARIAAEMLTGTVDDETLYILDTAQAAALKTAARKPIACGTIDAAYVCVSAQSYAPWRHLAALN
jgi:hypothetical protein